MLGLNESVPRLALNRSCMAFIQKTGRRNNFNLDLKQTKHNLLKINAVTLLSSNNIKKLCSTLIISKQNMQLDTDREPIHLPVYGNEF